MSIEKIEIENYRGLSVIEIIDIENNNIMFCYLNGGYEKTINQEKVMNVSNSNFKEFFNQINKQYPYNKIKRMTINNAIRTE